MYTISTGTPCGFLYETCFFVLLRASRRVKGGAEGFIFVISAQSEFLSPQRMMTNGMHQGCCIILSCRDARLVRPQIFVWSSMSYADAWAVRPYVPIILAHPHHIKIKTSSKKPPPSLRAQKISSAHLWQKTYDKKLKNSAPPREAKTRPKTYFIKGCVKISGR